MKQQFIHVGAIMVVWALIAIAAMALLAIPLLALGLANEFSEYARDVTVITALLGTPVVLTISLLAVILVLLRRIRIDRMLTKSAQAWVRVLSYNALALAGSFALIITWLSLKNTLPPSVGIVLLIGVFLPLAVALVTRSLLGLLQRATDASEELEGVI